jgi:hypothetical protein
VVGAFRGATNFSQSRYDPGMDIEKKKELWERLENEPERAFRAFESYRNLPERREDGYCSLPAPHRQSRRRQTLRHIQRMVPPARLARAGCCLRRPPRKNPGEEHREGNRGGGREAGSRGREDEGPLQRASGARLFSGDGVARERPTLGLQAIGYHPDNPVTHGCRSTVPALFRSLPHAENCCSMCGTVTVVNARKCDATVTDREVF